MFSPHTVSPDVFVSKVREELHAGFGFVPLVGTGLSAPSGIPIIREIQTYLARCIGNALGVEDTSFRTWHPRTDAWPPFGQGTGGAETRHDEQRYWTRKIQEQVEQFRETDAFHPHIKVFQEALGALADWKTALQFLARIDHAASLTPRGVLYAEDAQAESSQSSRSSDARAAAYDEIILTAPDNDVIDSFFLHVTKGKTPTLGHRMLAALAHVMRFRIVLTTNFDDLLEQAFSAADYPLTSFDVHLTAGLPPLPARWPSTLDCKNAWGPVRTPRRLLARQATNR